MGGKERKKERDQIMRSYHHADICVASDLIA
jgi:hypothetical protein